MRPGDPWRSSEPAAASAYCAILHGTSKVLYAAIENLKFNPQQPLGHFIICPDPPSDKEEFNSVISIPSEFDPWRPGFRVAEDLADQAFQDFRADGFAVGTLGAVGYVIRGMSALPAERP